MFTMCVFFYSVWFGVVWFSLVTASHIAQVSLSFSVQLFHCEDDVELLILLPQLPEYWDYGRVPSIVPGLRGSGNQAQGL